MIYTDIFKINKKYEIIYADPPWSYKVWSKATGLGRSAESHYKTMEKGDIENLPISNVSAPNSVLFLWVTSPCLIQGIELIEKWGFEYKTVAFTWVKKNKKADSLFWGMGYYTRSNAEFCLLATKGKVLKRESRAIHSVVLSQIEEHSKKPSEVRKRISQLFKGDKMFWFDKNNPDVTFCDIREVDTILCDGRPFSVKPNIICDFTNLPFSDCSYKLCVFDPPHLLRNTGKSKFADMYGSLNERATPTGFQHIKYGALYSDWRDLLRKGFIECFRVLEPNGILIFKWNETDIKTCEVLKLTPNKPLFGHISGKRSNTHWICFMKNGCCIEV